VRSLLHRLEGDRGLEVPDGESRCSGTNEIETGEIDFTDEG
jgi:hypothetical protein